MDYLPPKEVHFLHVYSSLNNQYFKQLYPLLNISMDQI